MMISDTKVNWTNHTDHQKKVSKSIQSADIIEPDSCIKIFLKQVSALSGFLEHAKIYLATKSVCIAHLAPVSYYLSSDSDYFNRIQFIEDF